MYIHTYIYTYIYIYIVCVCIAQWQIQKTQSLFDEFSYSFNISFGFEIFLIF